MMRRLLQGGVILVACGLLLFAWRCDVAWFERHVFLPQQFFIPANRAIAGVFRVAAAMAAGILFLAVPRIPRGAAARGILLGGLLSLPAAEIVLRWRIEKVIRPEVTAAMAHLTAPHPRYGITFLPSLDRVEKLSGREIRFRTDAQSRRIPGAAIDPESL